jgi:hypothetical protein
MKLQRERTIEGELVVGWLSHFDLAARLRRRKERKVFVIGLPKTGTTSVHHALQRVGYKSEHFPYRLVNYAGGELVLNDSDLLNHDAVSDLPVVAGLETLLELYPDALYVYTTREKERWLDSCRRHPWPLEVIRHAGLDRLAEMHARAHAYIRSIRDNFIKLRLMHERVLGSSVYVPEAFAAAYERHDKRVRRMFAGKRNLLELNIADARDRKEVLGEFLGVSMRGPFERKDCFYTWFFKKLTEIAGWGRIERMRALERERFVRAALSRPAGHIPLPHRRLPVKRCGHLGLPFGRRAAPDMAVNDEADAHIAEGD